MDVQTLRIKLSETPESIRTWFGSESVVTHISSINNELGLKDEQKRIIPRLVLRVEINDLEPQFFAGELANELSLDKAKAQAVTTEIKKSIFTPVKDKLIEYGIDINLLDKFEIPSVGIKRGGETKGISLEGLSATAQPANPMPVTIRPDRQETPAEGQPLILHKEEGTPAPAGKQFKGLEFPFGFFGKGEAPPSEPVKVKVEGLGSRLTKPVIKKEERKVVHYSELRTPLTPFQKPEEEIINLETFGQKQPGTKAPTPMQAEAFKPAAPAPRPQPKPQPKIEGNVVDLSR